MVSVGPVAMNDAYNIDMNDTEALNIAAPGVLGNDSFVENSTLTATVIKGCESGQLQFNNDGSFTYTPDAGFNRTDSFTYMFHDGVNGSNVANVLIDVTANGADLNLTLTADTCPMKTNTQTLEVSGAVTVSLHNDGEMKFTGSQGILVFEDRDANGEYDSNMDKALGVDTFQGGIEGNSVAEVDVPVSGTVKFIGSPVYVYGSKVPAVNCGRECNNQPEAGKYQPIVEWELNDNNNANGVHHPPLVAPLVDTNGDGLVNEKDTPAIIIAPNASNVSQRGELIALRGDTGEEIFRVPCPNIAGWDGSGSPAVGDIDGDGRPEIVILIYPWPRGNERAFREGVCLLVSHEQDNSKIPVRGDNVFCFGTSVPYNPANRALDGVYTLVTKGGLSYQVDGITGKLSLVKGPNANTLTYTDNGIFSSTGQQVLFERDTKGRITAVIDPMGNRIEYGYDARGDLVKVTDRERNATQFAYRNDIPHYLEEIIDPLGRTGIKTEYDENRRLVAMVDADGNRTQLEHGLATHTETIYDALGNPTTYEYDDRGNILTKIDALGHVTKMTYDENDNMLTETNPLGNTTSFTYDSRGNTLSKNDPLGNATTNAYDGWGNLLSIEDRLGNTTSIAEGNTTRFTYDRAGKRTGITDALGRETTFVYDQKGLLTETIFPDNTPNNLSDNPRIITEYYVLGRETAKIDELGRRTAFVYDRVGRLVESVFPDETPGDLSDNPRKRSECDAAGRVTAEVDERGNRREFEYDAAGRQRIVRDALGNETAFAYDAIGSAISQTDPLGRTTQFVYDANQKLIETVLPDGRTVKKSYDKNGWKTAITDQFDITTRYEYDDLGKLNAVVDAASNRTEFFYDERNRVTTKTLPDTSSVEYEYTATGKPLRVTNALGVTEFVYDTRDRLISRRNPDGTTVSYTYDEAGNIATLTTPSVRSPIAMMRSTGFKR